MGWLDGVEISINARLPWLQASLERRFPAIRAFAKRDVLCPELVPLPFTRAPAEGILAARDAQGSACVR